MKKVLIIRPWIYDFAAYDLWMQPMGLLYVASLLEENGVEIEYLDCLDPYDEYCKGKIKRLEDGRGKFYREEIEKPYMFKDIPRKYCRYGLPEEIVINKLASLKGIEAILITTMMTYWYLGVKRVVEICRSLFPEIPIILGGIYATLMPEHAERVISPDKLIRGSLDANVMNLLDYLIKTDSKCYIDVKELMPAWHYVKHLKYLPILTSRGCIFNCTYCASRILNPVYERREPVKVIDEVIFFVKRKGFKDVVFYDDALLVDAREYFLPIMEGLKENDIDVKFHTPNGLNARFIDEEIAEVMYEMNFQTVCLSLETADDKRNLLFGNKVSRIDFEKAMKSLYRAGYKPGSVDVYLMIGMPNQSKDEIREGIRYINDNGGIVKLSLYSAIPGTVEFSNLPVSTQVKLLEEPILQNNSIFSHYFRYLRLDEYEEIKGYADDLNRKIKRGAS